MKTPLLILICASGLLAAGCDSNQPKTNLYANFADPDQPQPNRYQLRDVGDSMILFDTATADMWALKDAQWVKLPSPVEEENRRKLDEFVKKFGGKPTK